MGRLLRLLLGTLARGLRLVAGRLTPGDAAPVAAVAPELAEPTDGPPGHWLEMVRRRAPGLHLSLQERGVTGRPVVPRVSRAPAPPSSPPPRPADEPAYRRRGRPAPAASPRAAPSPDPYPDPQPQAWEPPVHGGHGGQDGTTLVPLAAANGHPAPVAGPAAARLRHQRMDATTGDAGDAGGGAGATVAPGMLRPRPEATATRHGADTRPLRAARAEIPEQPPQSRGAPTAPAAEAIRYEPAAGPAARRGGEEPRTGHPARPRLRHPTPEPTPWEAEAVTGAVDGLPAGRFPPLPDERPPVPPSRSTVVAPHAVVIAPRASAITSLPPPIGVRPHRRHDAIQADPWPALPEAPIGTPRRPCMDPPAPAQAVAMDRWPALPEEDGGGGDEDGVRLPSGHRERLEREQRGLPWNG